MLERAFRELSDVAGDRRMAMAIPLATPTLAAYFPNATVIVLMLGALVALLRPHGGSFAVPPALRPFAVCFSALVAWAALSAFWSIDPEQSLVRALKIAALGLCGLILLRTALRLDEEERGLAAQGLLAGLCLLLVQLTVEVVTGGVITGLLHPSEFLDPAFRMLNLHNGAAVLAIFVWPGAAIARRRYSPPAAAVLVLLSLALALYIGSGSASLAIIVGGMAMALVRFGPKRAFLAIAVLSVLAVVLAPVLPNAISVGGWMRDIPGSVRFSVYHRSKIWTFTADQIRLRPILGWGMDSARSLPGGDALIDIDRDLEYEGAYGDLCDRFSTGASKTMPPPSPQNESPRMEQGGMPKYCTMPPYDTFAQVLPLHPHNAALQLWLELGALGALMGAALVFLAQIAIAGAKRSATGKAAAFGAFAAAFMIAGLSYGIWQSWWQSALWLTAVILVGVARPAAEASTP